MSASVAQRSRSTLDPEPYLIKPKHEFYIRGYVHNIHDVIENIVASFEIDIGAQRDRPELKAALENIRAGDMLVVWKLDRLARSIKQLIEAVEDLEKKGIGFKSLTENIDTTTSGGKLIFHIFASLAEFERLIIKVRTKAGLDAARARGKRGSAATGLYRIKTFKPPKPCLLIRTSRSRKSRPD